MNRQILKILLSVISGIILGLYLSSIAVLIYIIILIINFIFHNLKIQNITKHSLCISRENWIYFLISIIIFSMTYFVDIKYETLYTDSCEYSGTAEIISFAEEKNYTNKYIIKIKSLSLENQSIKNAKSTKLIIYVDKNLDLKYGDIISFTGTFEKASSQRNDGGFDYERYLRQSKIYGILDIENLEVLQENKNIAYHFYKLKNDLKEKLYEIFEEEEAGFLSGILLRR